MFIHTFQLCLRIAATLRHLSLHGTNFLIEGQCQCFQPILYTVRCPQVIVYMSCFSVPASLMHLAVANESFTERVTHSSMSYGFDTALSKQGLSGSKHFKVSEASTVLRHICLFTTHSERTFLEIPEWCQWWVQGSLGSRSASCHSRPHFVCSPCLQCLHGRTWKDSGFCTRSRQCLQSRCT